MARKIHVLHIKEINHFNKAGELLWKDEDLDNVLHDEASCIFCLLLCNGIFRLWHCTG